MRERIGQGEVDGIVYLLVEATVVTKEVTLRLRGKIRDQF